MLSGSKRRLPLWFWVSDSVVIRALFFLCTCTVSDPFQDASLLQTGRFLQKTSFLAKTHLDQSVGQSLRQRFYSFKPEWEWRPLEFPVQFPMLSQCANLWLNHKRTTKIDRLHFPVVSLTSAGFSLAHQDVSFSFFCSYSVCCYWLPGFQPSPLKM